ncbi:EscT/YscT/HrcT family type III secretion system export apparatus protein [Opitutaceae bacterium EW11]|nr:EscT/YscT/HrcT family type III secretion system export apparatus protein [Opitutaceae bacterium EW11]
MPAQLPLQDTLLMLTFTLPRMTAALTTSPFFSQQFIQGMARQVVIISFTLIAVPIVAFSATPAEVQAKSGLFFGLIVAKEISLGIILGYVSGLVFWIAEGTGFFIDNQRGSSMAEVMDPISDTTTSPLGLLLTKIVAVLFFTGGGFHAFLVLLYESYRLWPVFQYFPSFHPNLPAAALGVVDGVMGYIVLFAAPLVLAMFLAEFGLGLVNRFSPQLNVFFLAMPVKSAIAAVLLLVYLSTLTHLLEGQFVNREKLQVFFQALFR